MHMSRLTALGEMASTLAHELNQPLSAIANYLTGGRRLLEKSPPDIQRAAEAMGRASDQALRAGEIIRRLRDFVARGEGERSIESLSKMVEEASALALIGAKEHGIRVIYRFDPQADLVLADKVQVQQVTLNLVRNAIDAMMQSPRKALTIATDLSGADGFARVSGRGHRPRPQRGGGGAAVPAVRDHQGDRHGRRPLHFAHHHRGARRAHLGRIEQGWRRHLQLHAEAGERTRGRRCRLSLWCT